MERKIIMVTGGQRSGKSEFAEQLALDLSDAPVYVATARVYDSEMQARVAKHQQRRAGKWLTIEEDLRLSSHDVSDRVVLVDCVTLWATNMFFECGDDADAALSRLKEEFNAFTSQKSVFIFVTNEIGLGGTSENAMQRHFTDLQGAINRYIAAHAQEVYFVVSGIAMKIKG